MAIGAKNLPIILFNLSCFICDCKYVFIRFEHENEHSVEQFAAGVHIKV